ncbi:MAG: putative lipid II flippase FtsW [Micrococcales bacterium]|nr:putative lipid II flippase FtsW [Micrococcales bacterium]MCL2667366.1 putative lipid II flippase FtsW [Micrococcales bacterium]
MSAPARTGAPHGAGPRGPQRVRAFWAGPLTTYYLLIGSTVLLLVLGLVMVLSSSAVDSIVAGRSPYATFADQTKYALLGLPIMLVATRMTTAWQARLAWFALVGALAFQALVFVPGIGCGSGGNQNWVCTPVFSAQPSEAVKLALALWLGVVLVRKQPLLGQVRHVVVPALVGSGVAVAAVLAGKDLGTTLVIVLLVAGALFVAGVPMWMFSTGSVAAVVGVTLFIVTDTGSNRTQRIGSWLGDCTDAAGQCFQTDHGTWALASGGVFGLGLGESRQKWSYLPAAHNDFIFAIIGEELGLAGTLLVLGLFAVLAVAMLRIIRHHPEPSARITTGAVLAWVVGQALINIAVVLRLAPVIGVPLPLVSAGGSALTMTMAALGVVISYARSDPQAAAALAARPGVLRRSIAVLGISHRRSRRA